MSVFASASAFVVASVVLGAGIACRREWTWTAPATGLAALVLIAVVAVRLPGHGVTAAVAVGIALVAAAVALARARASLRALLAGIPVAVLVLAFCALPFLANGRVGDLGASTLDDIWFHMDQAEVLRETGTSRQVLADGYPIGPHAAVAATSEATDIGVAPVFTGLTLAAPALLALVALAALGRAPWPLRIVCAALVGIPYLVAAYLAEGAFKEPLLALLVLGFALVLREAVEAGRLERAQGVALALIAAAGVAVFGLAALLWPAVILAWLALVAALPAAGRLRLPSRRILAAAAAGAAAAAAALAFAAVASGFFDTGPGRFVTDDGVGGNFVGQLSPFEALGVWPRPDFRLDTGGKWWLVPGAALATALVLLGLFRARRDRALLAAALGVTTVYAVARPATLAYFSGKALAVAAPVLMLVAVRGLLAGAPQRPPLRAALAVAGAAFAMLALYSSALALRAAHVRPHDRGTDLSAFRAAVGDSRVLYLARDTYVGWELRGARIAGFQPARGPRLTPLMPVSRKSAGAPPPAVDVDSPGPHGLDGHRWVVTPRTAYASAVPANLRPVARTRWSVLWERRGPTPARLTLDEGEAPGADLDCRTAKGRALSRARGVAYVRPRPVAGRPSATVSGEPVAQTLDLGPGTWEVALRWFSDMPLDVLLNGEPHTLPAYLTDRASYAAVGRVTTAGEPLRIEVRPQARGRLGVVRTTLLGAPVATRVDRPGRLVPLRRACGRYVDWFRATAP